MNLEHPKRPYVIVESGAVLQSITRTGKKKYWKAGVYSTINGDIVLIKTWAQEGSVVQHSTPSKVFGKNIGKANETTPKEQAILELSSLYTKQLDKGYSIDGSQDHIPTKPMLAHSYEKRSHNITFPCFVQPKLDGFRMLMDGKHAWTRGAKEHVAECVAHLMFDTGGLTLDGELILPGNRPLQETSKAAKKFRQDVSPTLEYWVYDYVSDQDFEYRNQALRVNMSTWDIPVNVKTVPTYLVRNEEELFARHYEFTDQGFEGTMVRNTLGGYDIGNRSPNLQKLKDFQDSEFLVVDIIDGKGIFEGKAIVVCETPEGKQFNVTPQGTMEIRSFIYQHRQSYIGWWLTVKYQTLSEDGIPIFPVGINFRAEDEFNG